MGIFPLTSLRFHWPAKNIPEHHACVYIHTGAHLIPGRSVCICLEWMLYFPNIVLDSEKLISWFTFFLLQEILFHENVGY